MEVLHTAIEIADLDTSRRFYEDILGLERTREFETGGTHNYYVGGSGTGELQFKVVEEKAEPAGIHHIAIATDDVEATIAKISDEFDLPVTMEPRTIDRKSIRLAEVIDPEGYRVHLIEEL